jgi:hypothetical protein
MIVYGSFHTAVILPRGKYPIIKWILQLFLENKHIVLSCNFQVGSLFFTCKRVIDVHILLGALSKLVPIYLTRFFYSFSHEYIPCEWRELQICSNLVISLLYDDLLWLVLSCNFFQIKKLMLMASL